MVKVPLNTTTGALGAARFSKLPVRVFIKEKPEGLVLDCEGKRYARRYQMRDFKMKVHKKLMTMIKAKTDSKELVKFFLASNKSEVKRSPFDFVSADLPKPVKHSKEFLAKQKKKDMERIDKMVKKYRDNLIKKAKVKK